MRACSGHIAHRRHQPQPGQLLQPGVYLESEIAAAAAALALHIKSNVQLPTGLAQLEYVSGRRVANLLPCMTAILAAFRNAETNYVNFTHQKYSHAKFLCVSTLTPPDTTP